MSETIDQYIAQNDHVSALEQCLRENKYALGILIAKICNKKTSDPRFHNVFARLLSALKGINVDGLSIDNTIDVNESSETGGETIDVNETSETGGDHLLDKLLEPEIEVAIEPEIENSLLPVTRVMLLCNWCESKDLCDTWNKMSKGNYTWNNIQIVWEEPAEYYVIINCPPITMFPDPSKTILFHMEPHMRRNKHMWGDWGDPPATGLKFCGTHSREYNNTEWHLSKSYSELSETSAVKDADVCSILSTVLSDKYSDPGHIKRIDFVKFLEKKNMDVHVFGGNKFEWAQYKGSLPYHKKDDAMFPYKYVFNAENHEIRNYYTEKLVDGILAECLVFYWGCPNIRDFFDEKAFVSLDLLDFEKDFNTIKTAIEENWWEERLPYIRAAKQRILNEKQFFPRLERILADV